jgi:outer membrane protein assembly factor BamB
MLQRWMKTLVVLVAGTTLFTACKKEYSTDEPFPEVFNPLLYITTQNQFLYALSPSNGKKAWEYYTGSQVTGTPVVLGDYLFLPTVDSVVKMDAKRGTLVKSYKVIDRLNNLNIRVPRAVGGVSSSLAGKGVMLYVPTNGEIVAIDVNEDLYKWSFSTPDNNDVVGSPTIADDQLIFATSRGKVFGLNINNGTKNWEFTAGGAITSSTTVVDDQVFVGCNDNNLYCLNATTGAVKWTFTTGGFVESSPIAYGGYVIFGSSDHNLYCIDTAAKKPIWVFKTGDRILSSPTAEKNVVYVGSYDYNFYAINVIDGAEKWRMRTNALIYSSPILHERTLYFGSHDKTLYAVDTNGYLRFSHNTNGILESSPVIWDLTKSFYPSVSGMSKY